MVAPVIGIVGDVVGDVVHVLDPVVEQVVAPVIGIVGDVVGDVVQVLDPVVEQVVAPVVQALDPVVAPVVEVFEPSLRRSRILSAGRSPRCSAWARAAEHPSYDPGGGSFLQQHGLRGRARLGESPAR